MTFTLNMLVELLSCLRMSRAAVMITLGSVLTTTTAMARIVVDANAKPCIYPSAHYTTIQSAVAAAPAGSTIYVCPGTYAEQVSIARSVALKGVQVNNMGAAVIAVPSGGGVQNGGPVGFPVVAQVDITATNVTLQNITIDGTDGDANSDCSEPFLVGIAFEAGSSGEVIGSALRNQAVANNGGLNGYCAYAIQVFAGAGGLVTIQGNSIRGFGYGAVAADSPVTVKNNQIYEGLTSANLLDQGTGIAVSAPSTVAGNFIHHVAFGIVATKASGAGATTISYNQISADTWGVTLSGSGTTVTNNTITGGLQNPGLTGGNVGVNLSGSSGGDLIKGNTVAGFYYGVLSQDSNTETITYNTINDAQVGIQGVTGNSVSNNRFSNTTTLTMP